jgi:lipoprotein-releasing system permease protein
VPLARRIARRFASSLRRDGFARFTSVVSYGSVALGCIAVILAMSILDGYEQMVRSTMMRFTAPIEVRSLMHPVFDPTSDAFLDGLRAIEGVQHVELQRSREALGRSRSGVDGILMIGTTSVHASARIAPMLTQGTIPAKATSGMAEVVIGVGVAQRLALILQDTMVVYTAMTDQSAPIIAPVRVVGMFRSGMQQYDETGVIVRDSALVTMLRMPQSFVTSIAVYPTSITDLDTISNLIRASIDKRSGLYVQTYRERFATIES